jgi:molecular chaperone HtpG
VSRSYLQGDPNVKKINNHITKKVADKLDEIFRTDRPSFEEKWDSLGLFVKYGMMTDDKFLEKANAFHVFKDAKQLKYFTMEELRAQTEVLQKNKDGKLVILYTTDPVQQDAYIQGAAAKGYTVVSMETIVDAAFINNMEMKWSDVTFTRVDADITDNLIDKGEDLGSVLSKEEEEKLKSLFQIQTPSSQVSVEIKGLAQDTAPVLATRPEFMRRMKDMAAISGPGASFYASMPDEVTLTVNGNHKVIQQILKTEDTDRQQKLVRNLADLALLSQGLLKGNELTSFINRNVELMES